MIIRANFFASVRASLFGGKLTQDHVTNMEGILDYAIEQGIPVQQIAYMLAKNSYAVSWFLRTLCRQKPLLWQRKSTLITKQLAYAQPASLSLHTMASSCARHVTSFGSPLKGKPSRPNWSGIIKSDSAQMACATGAVAAP